MSSQKKKGMNLERKQNFTGWVFLLPATILIAWMSFYPMIQAFILSLQTGMGINLKFNGFANYARILKDPTFKQTLSNTFLYLIIQVPIMLILGLMFATVYKGNIIKNLIMDCQSYTKYRPNETTGGIFVSWRRKEELPTGA